MYVIPVNAEHRIARFNTMSWHCNCSYHVMTLYVVLPVVEYGCTNWLSWHCIRNKSHDRIKVGHPRLNDVAAVAWPLRAL